MYILFLILTNNFEIIIYQYSIIIFCLSIDRKQSALLEEKRNKLNEKLEKREKRKKKKKDKNKNLGDHFCVESGPSSSRYIHS